MTFSLNKPIDDIFEMFTPIDLVGKTQPDLGGPTDQTNSMIKQLISVLENTGRGVYPHKKLREELVGFGLKFPSDTADQDLSSFITIWTLDNVVDLGRKTDSAKKYIDSNGKEASVQSLGDIIGAKFKGKTSKMTGAVILSNSPFFNPSVRNCKRAEMFLNSMPSTVLAQLVPFVHVEFQVNRDPSDQLQSMSMLKFLMGAEKKDSLVGANKALLQSQQISGVKDQKGEIANPEVNFFGMEMFTSPQTLTNPQPNKKVGTNGNRYVDVIDPFRPFATLEHVNINSIPAGAGYFTYKKGQMTIKIHDRSRLHEISDFIRPRVYTGVTIWLTYGWRAPNHKTNNPYFRYVNDNLMMREAYYIMNSNFSFDQLGQVTLNLELYTKGVGELRNLKINDNNNDMSFRTGELRNLIDRIALWRKRLRLDAAEGLSKEVRIFQILDAAEAGEFTDLDPQDILKRLDDLNNSLLRTKNPDAEGIRGLITDAKKIFKADEHDKKKFDFKKRYETRVAHIIEELFEEVVTGPDPFLPIAGKEANADLIAAIEWYSKPPVNDSKNIKKSVVSFGKLFTVFALRQILSMPDVVEEVQVFFYQLNMNCGPISGHNIASFPIFIPDFRDQFVHEVTSRGGEKLTLETFLSLCINAQFLDIRAIGYGLKKFYAPFEIGKDAKIPKDQERAAESARVEQTRKYGAFKKPAIAMYIETCHARVNEAGDNDILQQLQYSNLGGDINLSNQAYRIMRIHISDKQLSAYQTAAALLRSEDDSHFLTGEKVETTKYIESFKQSPGSTIQQINDATNAKLQYDLKNGVIKKVDSFVNNQMIKDVVSKFVPTIRFGANGTTVINANLASKADPLQSTVQMQKVMTVRNNAAPNGSGELGTPLRVIPAMLTMTTMGNPLATMAQNYFIDFQTGTTLDNLYIVTGLTHTFAPGKFETQWTFGYGDAYGVFEGAQNIRKAVDSISPTLPKDPKA